MAELQLDGWAEIKQRFADLPDKMMKRVLTQAMREAANLIKDEAKAQFGSGGGAPNEISGWLKSTIRVTARRGTPTRVVFNVVAGGEYTLGDSSKIHPSYAVWVERGHLINRTNLSKPEKAARHMANRIGNTSGMVPPHPFMRPAIEQGAQAAIDRVIMGISDRLPEAIT